MNKLSFWYKVAFIANCCWLLTWCMKYYSLMPAGDLQSTVIITGLVIANIVNFVVNLCACVYLLRKKLGRRVPRWLLLANFVFLMAQLYIFIQ